MSASSLFGWLPGALPPRAAVRSGHEARFGDKPLYGKAFPPMTTLLKASSPPSATQSTQSNSDPAELAKRIIRQQWGLRRHPDVAVRRHARSLIQSHVEMLRIWR
jgi:hypothetical protein